MVSKVEINLQDIEFDSKIWTVRVSLEVGMFLIDDRPSDPH